MAVIKAKRSVHPSKATRRDNRLETDRHSEQSKRAERKTQIRSTSIKATRHYKRSQKRTTSPGQFVLNERNLPHRRFVEFPLAHGKTTEKVELFTTRGYHSITIDFQDHTSLNLTIEPTFILNAEFQQRGKGDIEVLAEWPPIHPQK